MSLARSIRHLTIALVFGGSTGAIGCAASSEEDVSVAESGFHGATRTLAHPEVGNLIGATGTLIAPDVVLTAAHVAELATGRNFVVTASDGRTYPYAVERTSLFYLYPHTHLHVDDLALVFLKEEVPLSIAHPASIAQREPRTSPPEHLHAFGHGGTDCVFTGLGEITQSDAGPKREIDYWWSREPSDVHRASVSTALGCPGDSGGPHFSDAGQVIAITSSLTGGANGKPRFTSVAVVSRHADWILGQLDCRQRRFALGAYSPIAACDGCRCYDGVALGGRRIQSKETSCGYVAQGQNGNYYRCEQGDRWSEIGRSPCGRGVEVGGRIVEGNVGTRVCGTTRRMYTCDAEGWRQEPTTCAGGACDLACSGGRHFDGSLVTDPACGTMVCGQDGVIYGCGPSGWARTGQRCRHRYDIACRGLSRSQCESPEHRSRCGWYTGSSSCWPRGTPNDVAHNCACAGGKTADGIPIPVHEATCNRQVFGNGWVSYRCTADGWRPESLL